MAEALAVCREILSHLPNQADAIHLSGVIAHQTGSNPQALELIRRAIVQRTDAADMHINLGTILRAMGELDEAAAAFTRAIELLRRDVALQPNSPAPSMTLGDVLREEGRWNEAVDCYRQAIALQPDLAWAHITLGLMLLSLGDFEQGWREFDWRWRIDVMQQRQVQLAKPRWQGGDLTGKRILLHAERGGGDTLNFVRHAADVKRRGATTIFACQPELTELLAGVAGIDEWATRGKSMPAFDFHCSLIDLPGALGVNDENLAAAPYIFPDQTRVDLWRQRIPADGRLKVGLVWSGQINPLQRHLVLSDLAPLADLQNVWFCSLQKGDAAKQPAPPGLNLTDWTNELKDYTDTAALIANLDLVVSVDTSVGHLAGAMGRRTFLMLKSSPDFRWMLNRKDSPWYPSMQLFRQPQPGDWTSVVNELAAALKLGAERMSLP